MTNRVIIAAAAVLALSGCGGGSSAPTPGTLIPGASEVQAITYPAGSTLLAAGAVAGDIFTGSTPAPVVSLSSSPAASGGTYQITVIPAGGLVNGAILLSVNGNTGPSFFSTGPISVPAGGSESLGLILATGLSSGTTVSGSIVTINAGLPSAPTPYTFQIGAQNPSR